MRQKYLPITQSSLKQLPAPSSQAMLGTGTAQEIWEWQCWSQHHVRTEARMETNSWGSWVLSFNGFWASHSWRGALYQQMTVIRCDHGSKAYCPFTSFQNHALRPQVPRQLIWPTLKSLPCSKALASSPRGRTAWRVWTKWTLTWVRSMSRGSVLLT